MPLHSSLLVPLLTTGRGKGLDRLHATHYLPKLPTLRKHNDHRCRNYHETKPHPPSDAGKLNHPASAICGDAGQHRQLKAGNSGANQPTNTHPDNRADHKLAEDADGTFDATHRDARTCKSESANNRQRQDNQAESKSMQPKVEPRTIFAV